MQDVDTSQLLSDKWNSAYWHLLWFFLAPIIYYGLRYLHRAMNRDPAQPLIDTGIDVPSDVMGTYGGLGMLSAKDAKPDMTKTSLCYPRRVAEIMQRYDVPYGIAGGWAIDLHLGQVTRPHDDIEIAVLRRDQGALWTYIAGWHPHVVAPGSVEHRPWERAEVLELPVHEIHTRAPQADVNELEFLLNEASDMDWVYRRDKRIHLPMAQAFMQTESGVPYLAPEIVLLYKSVNTRQCDEADFANAKNSLSYEQRTWLIEALELTAPGHAWLAELIAMTDRPDR